MRLRRANGQFHQGRYIRSRRFLRPSPLHQSRARGFRDGVSRSTCIVGLGKASQRTQLVHPPHLPFSLLLLRLQAQPNRRRAQYPCTIEQHVLLPRTKRGVTSGRVGTRGRASVLGRAMAALEGSPKPTCSGLSRILGLRILAALLALGCPRSKCDCAFQDRLDGGLL